ncbi:MAG: TetR-like C-terminal domain-containing protein [Mycobacterium sp.]
MDGLDGMVEMSDLHSAERSREVILNAAVAELATKHLDGFTLERVAARAGVDQVAVKQMWPNAAALFAAAYKEFGERHIPMPDTGTLRGDLLDYAKSYAANVNTPTGRRLLDALIVSPTDWDVSGSREAYVSARNGRAITIIRRGIERGECAPGTDAVRAADLFRAALSVPVLFYDRPITDTDCEVVVGTVLDGIAANPDGAART